MSTDTHSISSTMLDQHRQPAQEGTTVREHRPAVDVVRPKTTRSPHLIDLAKPVHDERRAEAIKKAAELHRNPGLRFRQMLDERIHLKDLHARSLSVRARGWRDFPPKDARSLGHAVTVTVSTFFSEHPLAELTVFSLLHVTGVIIWRAFVYPIKVTFETLGGQESITGRSVESPSLLPIVPTPAAAPAIPSHYRGLVGFAVTAMILVLPLGAYSSYDNLLNSRSVIFDRSMEGLALLMAAGDDAKSQDFSSASSAFTEAAERFSGAKKALGSLGNLVAYTASLIPSDSPLTAAQPILTAGHEVAIGGAMLSSAFAALDDDSDPISRLRVLQENLASSLPHLARASDALRRVSPDALPENYRATFTEARRELPRLTATIAHAQDVAGFLQGILGAEGTRRYLVVFQNNAELRATGGFIGSFALLDVDSGEIKNIEIPGGGSYDLQGSLRARVISPQPLHLINPHWEFQDANWSPDFPTSAERLTWFYNKSGGPSVDGVIALNMDLIPRLLAILGPVEMPEYGKTITAENFYIETQKQVEVDYDKTANKPKQFIADLAPILIQRMTEADKASLLPVLVEMDKALSQKDIQMWMRDEELQSQLAGFGWDGAMRSSESDYLQIVDTNIAGQKTDLVMRNDVSHDVKILADGTGIVSLTIARTHTGTAGEPFSGVRNVNFLRVYVPKDSVLVEASGFEQPDPKLFKLPENNYVADPAIASIEDGMRTDRASGTRTWNENGKTVFGNWSQTDPGETDVLTLVYRLPPGVVRIHDPNDGKLAEIYRDLTDSGGKALSYSLVVQRQSGSRIDSFTSYVNAPKGYYMEWQSPARTEDERGRAGVEIPLSHDTVLTTVLRAR